MPSQFDPDLAPLTESFTAQTASQKFTIQWTSLGDSSLPPLIFIHGTPWSSRVWVPFALSLCRKFRVYLFDRPGFGESTPEEPLEDTSDDVIRYDGALTRQSEAFAMLFAHWQKDWRGAKPHVVAHDNAGLISLTANLVHGCDYASLCLLDVVAIGPFGQSLFNAIAKDPSHFMALPEMAFEGILESYIRHAAYYPLSEHDMGLLKRPWLRDGGQKRFMYEMCQACNRSTAAVEDRYAEVGKSMPVKIIWGKKDRWIPWQDAQRLGDALGAKEVVIIDRGGHLIMFDQAIQVGVEIGWWLGE